MRKITKIIFTSFTLIHKTRIIQLLETSLAEDGLDSTVVDFDDPATLEVKNSDGSPNVSIQELFQAESEVKTEPVDVDEPTGKFSEEPVDLTSDTESNGNDCNVDDNPDKMEDKTDKTDDKNSTDNTDLISNSKPQVPLVKQIESKSETQGEIQCETAVTSENESESNSENMEDNEDGKISMEAENLKESGEDKNSKSDEVETTEEPPGKIEEAEKDDQMERSEKEIDADSDSVRNSNLFLTCI